MAIYSSIQSLLDDLISFPALLPDSRLATLHELGEYIRRKQENGEPAKLNFICTHNSRRSHLSQIWAEVWAYHFNLIDFTAYSGGTEATAFHPNAISALQKQGFVITGDQSENPRYQVRFGEDSPLIECWSKEYSDPENPATGFGAVMVCDSAEEACPFVAGAEKRFGITYTDPKLSDGTPEQEQTYQQRSLQIGGELYLAFQHATR